MENIRVKDFRINMDKADRICNVIAARPVVNKYMRKKVPGHIKDCSFENISITGERAKCRFILEGKDADHKIGNVAIMNASIYGVPLKQGDKACHIGKFAENITIK